MKSIIMPVHEQLDEKTKDHSEKNWKMMLASLKKLLEESSN